MTSSTGSTLSRILAFTLFAAGCDSDGDFTAPSSEDAASPDLGDAAMPSSGDAAAPSSEAAAPNPGDAAVPDAAGFSSALDDAENIQLWANRVSALGVYLNFHEELAFSAGEHEYPDSSCPVVSEAGDVITIEGDCTEEGGKQWVGSVTIERSGDGDRELTYSDFGAFSDPDQQSTRSGTVVVRRINDSLHEFDVDLGHASDVTTTIEYSGSVEGGYTGRTVWNGSGTVSRAGSVSPTGTVSVNTVAQVIDSEECSGQPASGQTTISNDEHVVVVTYDGASDCDDDEAARFSVDGEDRGELTGIMCRVSPTLGRGDWSSAALGAFGLLAAAGLRLGRRRRTTAAAPSPTKVSS